MSRSVWCAFLLPFWDAWGGGKARPSVLLGRGEASQNLVSGQVTCRSWVEQVSPEGRAEAP